MKPLFLLALLSLAGCEVQLSDPNIKATLPVSDFRFSQVLPGKEVVFMVTIDGHTYLYINARSTVLLHSESCACKGASLGTARIWKGVQLISNTVVEMPDGIAVEDDRQP